MFDVWISAVTIMALIAVAFGHRFLFMLIIFAAGGIGATAYLLFRIVRWLFRNGDKMKKARIVLLLVALGMTACGTSYPVPVAQGPWKQFNANQWTPTQAELEALPR
jgi:hypothetical protein